MNDRDLLTTYQRTPSPQLFAQIVSTHINLVYSVARRHVKDPHLAEDISQEVFLSLARKAPSLHPDTPLAGWLFTTARLTSLESLRAKSRRTRHESEAAMSQQPPEPPDPTWSLIAEDIDKAVADLPPTDRDALLLRYFTGKSNSEIAATLAISEEAAKKRVQRALDALQKLLTSRGLAPTSALTALTLAAALTTHAVQAAPPALASSISTALATKSAATVATKGTLMAAAKLKTALITTAAVIAITASAGTAVYLSNRHAPAPAPVIAPTDSPAPAAADAPTPLPAASTPAPDDFLAAYALPLGRVIANIPDANPAARAALYQQKSRGQYQAIKETPGGMVIQWKDDQISIWGMEFGSGFPLAPVVNHLLDVYPPEIKSPIPFPSLSGDIVFSANATQDEYLASLQTLLSEHLKRPVTCSFRTEPMDAVVFSGRYHFAPVPDPPVTRNLGKSISFYVHQIDAQEGPGGGSGNARAFAGSIGERIGQPVIIDSPNFPKRISFTFNNDASSPLTAPADITLFLQHIAEQAGLTLTHETRPIRCLIIESKDQNQIPPADGWKGWTVVAYPATSPFQAVRWHNDTPEVQINDTWYQLLKFNDLPAEQIIAAAKSADREWQRRFEEDFVALLAYMGHEPAATAALEVKNLQTQKTETLTDIPLTVENRRAIMRARQPKPAQPPQ